jgi:hypothetical protein
MVLLLVFSSFFINNSACLLQTVTSESLLKPILSADEVSGIYSWTLASARECDGMLYANFFSPAVCVHGTYRRNLDSILQSGLKRMARLHVHFSSGLPSDGEVISGMLCNWKLTVEYVLMETSTKTKVAIIANDFVPYVVLTWCLPSFLYKICYAFDYCHCSVR